MAKCLAFCFYRLVEEFWAAKRRKKTSKEVISGEKRLIRREDNFLGSYLDVLVKCVCGRKG